MLHASLGLMIVLYLGETSSLVVPMRFQLLQLVESHTGGSSSLLCLCIDNWTGEVSCPLATQPIWTACWIDPPDGSSSSLPRAVLDAWDIYRQELGVVPPDVVLAL